MKWGQMLVVSCLRAYLNFWGVISERKAAAEAYKIFSTPFRKRRVKVPAVFKDCRQMTIHSGIGPVCVYQWNETSSQRILILHGFESCAYKFDSYIRPFIRRGCSVIAIDAPAHGNSPGKRLSLPDYIEAITATVASCGPIDAIMAHSFGGLALCRYLELHPELPGGRMVLIAPATETTTAIDTFCHFLQLGDRIRKSMDHYIEMLSGHPPTFFSLKRMVPILSNHHFLWIHDEGDRLTPFSDVVPITLSPQKHLTFKVTRGLGHSGIYRDSGVRKSIIDFLCTPGE